MWRLQLLFVLAVFPNFAFAQDASQLLSKWEKCVLASAYVYAINTEEAADIIAMGAFGNCERQILDYVVAVSEMTSQLNPERVLQLTKENENEKRNRVIAEVLNARYKSRREGSNAP